MDGMAPPIYAGQAVGEVVRHPLDGNHWPKLRADYAQQKAEREARLSRGKRVPRQLQPPGFDIDTMRFDFIHLTWEEVPRMWFELREFAGSAYKAALTAPRASTYRAELKGKAPMTRRVRPHSPPEMHALAEALMAWKQHWNLNADWCEQYALLTLDFWQQCPGQDGPTPTSLGWGGTLPREAAVWPQTRRAREVLAGQPEAWKLPTKGEREHLRWLVWYQCLKQSAASGLGEATGKFTEENTLKGVKRAAALLALPLRRSKRGPH